MPRDAAPDLRSAKEIIVIDYAHDEASPALPWAANRVLNELGRVREELDIARQDLATLRALAQAALSDDVDSRVQADEILRITGTVAL